MLPGFIDPHTHSLPGLSSREAAKRANANDFYQGVTTVFSGNGGFGPPDIAQQDDASIASFNINKDDIEIS